MRINNQKGEIMDIRKLENEVESLRFALTTLHCWSTSENKSRELFKSIQDLKRECVKMAKDIAVEIERELVPIIDHGPITKEQREKIAREQIEASFTRG